MDEDGNADYQNVEVLRALDVATLDLMKSVQDDIEVGEAMGDCKDSTCYKKLSLSCIKREGSGH